MLTRSGSFRVSWFASCWFLDCVLRPLLLLWFAAGSAPAVSSLLEERFSTLQIELVYQGGMGYGSLAEGPSRHSHGLERAPQGWGAGAGAGRSWLFFTPWSRSRSRFKKKTGAGARAAKNLRLRSRSGSGLAPAP